MGARVTLNGVSMDLFLLYYCKIWQGDTLVRDFVPVLDTEGVACLYDNVSKEYFYNSGSGEFSYQ